MARKSPWRALVLGTLTLGVAACTNQYGQVDPLMTGLAGAGVGGAAGLLGGAIAQQNQRPPAYYAPPPPPRPYYAPPPIYGGQPCYGCGYSYGPPPRGWYR